MKSLTILLLLTGSLHANAAIERHLLRNDVWETVDQSDEGYLISQSEIPGYPMHALQISAELDLNAAQILDVVHDIDNYKQFLKSAGSMSFEVLERSDSSVVGYQHIQIPYLSDRHYLYRFQLGIDDTAGEIVTGWELLPKQGPHDEFLALMDSVYDDTLYLDEGVGRYVITPLGPNRSRLSYRLYMDIGGWIPTAVLERINKISILDLVRDLVAEAERRSVI